MICLLCIIMVRFFNLQVQFFLQEFSEFLSAQGWEANGQPIRMTVRFHCVERFLQRYAKNSIFFFYILGFYIFFKTKMPLRPHLFLIFCNFICVKFGLSSLYIALLAIGRYSNFWGGMTESYYYERTQDYR